MQMQAMAELAASYVNTTNRHIFLTGKAGTGKTTFLKYIIEHTFKHTVVAAPTGIAAINAGGVTLHSLLQLPFGTFIPENIYFESSENKITTPQTLFKNSKFNSSKRQLIQEIELLIIDEVSMLRADLLDCMDHTLRYLRKNNKAFGGIQILFIGDLMQLPPVVKDDEKELLHAFYPSLYFFEAQAIKDNRPIHVELTKIFRQQDQDFIDLLNRLRHNKQTESDINFLSRYHNPDFNQAEETGYIHLTTHNYRADKLNRQKLTELEAETFAFQAHIEGTFPESMFPIAPELHLKEGAQVMFIKNDTGFEAAFFNGKIGIVSNVSEEEIWVRFEDGSEVLVPLHKWENKRYILNKETNEIEETFLGSFEHYPIKLAWAVTVHKSQGLTFEKAILDLSGTFAPGQLYVALSRLTSLRGLVLSSPLPESPPAIDAQLASFNSHRDQQEQLKTQLFQDQKQFIIDLSKVVFAFNGLIQSLTYHERSFNKNENRSIKQQHLPWTKELIQEVSPLVTIGINFTREIQKILIEKDFIDHLLIRIGKAENYFIQALQNIVEKIQLQKKTLGKEKNVKAYKKELSDLEDAFIKKIREIERMAFLVQSLKSNEKDFSPKVSVQLLQTKNKKEDVKNTKELTYDLFKSGKSINQIAAIRDLTISTIEGHLAHYVAINQIPIEELIDSKKIETILEALESDAVGLGEIKKSLPKNYSYGEIKWVIAYKESKL